MIATAMLDRALHGPHGFQAWLLLAVTHIGIRPRWSCSHKGLSHCLKIREQHIRTADNLTRAQEHPGHPHTRPIADLGCPTGRTGAYRADWSSLPKYLQPVSTSTASVIHCFPGRAPHLCAYLNFFAIVVLPLYQTMWRGLKIAASRLDDISGVATDLGPVRHNGCTYADRAWNMYDRLACSRADNGSELLPGCCKNREHDAKSSYACRSRLCRCSRDRFRLTPQKSSVWLDVHPGTIGVRLTRSDDDKHGSRNWLSLGAKLGPLGLRHQDNDGNSYRTARGDVTTLAKTSGQAVITQTQ
ncbi:hypothetical protein C8Q73DRAFT_245801 [Cubamyces lactineus]|nr:hypothetical protein C8Q73DRAFT_245801 [Cubamyces lactineus]